MCNHINDNSNSAKETIITYGEGDTLLIESNVSDSAMDKNTMLGMILSLN